ncbi:serine hydrolase domain-containing protein [Gracilimonas sp.]|uniref:serine hydrolase domain-containing protein n=1 Tax=Gracilimonas sp. TaxID=1974203 RepID=UPI00287264DA|nr:serine hydrolase domain-containing protein [Gracilimonas sp.]
MKKITLFLLPILLLWISGCNTPDPGTQQDINAADEVLQTYVEEHNIPGMSVSVYRDGDIIWSKGYGYMDVENQVPIDPASTLFRIGSVSKTYTAAGAGLLIQEGALNTQEPVQTYVPDFPEKKYEITVEQVAGHIAGIRHYRGDEFLSDKKYTSISEGLEIFKDDTLLFEPGTDYSYSSYGWNLISAVMESASGQEFLPFMQNEVFGALNMTNSMPDHADQDIPNRTHFYVYNDSLETNEEAPYVDNSYKWAGGGFLSTTEDMIKFGEAHLSGDFLNMQTLDQLMQPLQTSNGESTGYGFGWSTFIDSEGTEWKGHSGGSVGGSTMFFLHRENGVVVAFAINRSGAPMGDLRDDLASIFID